MAFKHIDVDKSFSSSGIVIQPDLPICQTDLPLDWYQDEFKSYAEEYLALPDRLPGTVLPWMDQYVMPALDHFGEALVLLAHYYMGGEIVKVVGRYGGFVADSYALALQTQKRPQTRIFVESAVHFMAESIAILANPDQEVWITNPRSGCTMEMMAKDHMLEPAWESLRARFGNDIVVVAYMNTSGRVKAIAGESGGAVCTSSNAPKVVDWARKQGKRIFFVPDEHLGRNTAYTLGMDKLAVWPGPQEQLGATWDDLDVERQASIDAAEMILWGGFCGVHTVFKPEHVTWWKGQGYEVVAHPECTREVVALADGHGSTRFLWDYVMDARRGAKIAVATEGHFVKNVAEQAELRGVKVVNMADIPDPALRSMGCGCATMSRNDPPHLVAILDLLHKGEAPQLNRVLPGDIVNERTGWRERLGAADQATVVENARLSLQRMIDITEA